MNTLSKRLVSLAALIPVALAVTSAGAQTPVILLCKGLNAANYKGATLFFEKITVTTPTGSRDIFAPTSVKTFFAFVPATTAAGSTGQNLTAGQCGLASSVLSGVSKDPWSPATLTFQSTNYNQIQLSWFNPPPPAPGTSTASNQPASNINVSVPPSLPNCTVYKIDAYQQTNKSMFYVPTDAAVTCLQ